MYCLDIGARRTDRLSVVYDPQLSQEGTHHSTKSLRFSGLSGPISACIVKQNVQHQKSGVHLLKRNLCKKQYTLWVKILNRKKLIIKTCARNNKPTN